MDRIKKISFFCITCLFFVITTMLFSHEGHHSKNKELIIEHRETTFFGSSLSLSEVIHWFSRFHLILLHFPITLIIMTVFSELLFYKYGSVLFDHASRFMIIAAAIIIIPTALSGFAFEYEVHYDGVIADLFWWHRFFGVITTILTIAAAVLRELHIRRNWNTMKSYYICLAILFISVNLTCYFGGRVAFG